MSSGMTGFLPFGADDFKNSMWIAGKTGRSDEQGGEYYMNGMIPLSCQIDVPELRELREASIAKILHTQASDGIFGSLPHGDHNVKHDYWGRMIIVLALESYVECDGKFGPNATMKQAVEAALVAHHKGIHKRVSENDPPFWHCPWGSARYAEVLIGAQWLIDRGHTDTELWDLMNLVRAQSEGVLHWQQWFVDGDPTCVPGDPNYSNCIRCWGNKSDPAMREFMTHHGSTPWKRSRLAPSGGG